MTPDTLTRLALTETVECPRDAVTCIERPISVSVLPSQGERRARVRAEFSRLQAVYAARLEQRLEQYQTTKGLGT